ncbi:MAG: SDR family oxidoreductase [Gemmatimonadaceae bacterium]|nr:SDR family oxidoreductase [Gemmatimonadaceae bacterium]
MTALHGGTLTQVATGAETAATGRAGRLAGKVALVTGAAGNLGGHIVRHYLSEGATVVLTGRDLDRVEAARAACVEATGVPDAQASVVTLDGADPASVRTAMAAAIARHGRLDIVVNNAGSAGPRQPLRRVPITREELAALQAEGATDSETVGDAMRSILGVAWHVANAAAKVMQPGGSIINISTIFSRTEYYARSPYVVPKSALNALSKQLSFELGDRGIRVNTVYPGPIRSERIQSVFATMDTMRGDDPGTTATTFTGLMSLKRAGEDPAAGRTFPMPKDVANTCVFLGSDESAAFNGHDFEVTHGMWVRKESRSEFVSRPTMRTVDGSGLAVLVACGDQLEDGLAVARLQAEVGAAVLLGVPTDDDVGALRSLLNGNGLDSRIRVARFDRSVPETMERALAEGPAGGGAVHGAIIMPAYGPERFTGLVCEAGDDDIQEFIDHELTGAVALARTLSRYWSGRTDLPRNPRFVMMSNGSDGAWNSYADMLRAALEALTRVWRDETKVDVKHGRRQWIEWGNQIIRYGNNEPENRRFAAGQAARLICTDRRIPQVNLYMPKSIVKATGAKRAMLGFMENLTGLHLGKVALITGGSAGIGGQVARLLAMAGARVMLVARRESELEVMRAQIVGELEDVGYSGAERRVRTMAGVDVGDVATLRLAVDGTLAAFGRIDYLINNAGVAGAEEMVVDMSLDAWRYTLDANLVSNYALLKEVVPVMRKQGSGYILNVSSYFGGEKHLAVAYPNRADYAVSKAGQRALVESLARHLGPEIQINAIAPGPVDGDRLRGLGGKPGLFMRRGRLILENKRLNAAHSAVIRAVRRGMRVESTLEHLAANDVVQLTTDLDVPHELRELANQCRAEAADGATWGDYLMTPSIAERLLARLTLGGLFLDSGDWTPPTAAQWLRRLPPEDLPFLPPSSIEREAEKVNKGVMSLLHLRRMPTEVEVALATVFFLADRAVSGETFMPSGGLNLERSITERELFGSAKRERLDQLRGRTVWLIGEHLVPHLAEAARQLAEICSVGKIVLLTRTLPGADAIEAAIPRELRRVLVKIPCGDDIEAGMNAALKQAGRPTTVISTPFAPLPDLLFGRDGEVLDAAAFKELVDVNLTHHFRVARKASMLDDAQLVLVSPDVPAGGGGEVFSLANFVKSTLHALTATLAVENERLVNDVPVNQINLTRRVRSEEPRNEEETLEEVRRFARAVLLAGAPLPDAEDSRYRSRIYRGMAITV